MDEVRKKMRIWMRREEASDPSSPRSCTLLLDHKYSELGLSFRNLKSKDRTKGELVREVAEELGFSLYLAQIHVTITGLEEDECMMDEDSSTTCTTRAAVGVDGRQMNLTNLHVQENDMYLKFNVNTFDPDKTESEGTWGIRQEI